MKREKKPRRQITKEIIIVLGIIYSLPRDRDILLQQSENLPLDLGDLRHRGLPVLQDYRDHHQVS